MTFYQFFVRKLVVCFGHLVFRLFPVLGFLDRRLGRTIAKGEHKVPAVLFAGLKCSIGQLFKKSHDRVDTSLINGDEIVFVVDGALCHSF